MRGYKHTTSIFLSRYAPISYCGGSRPPALCWSAIAIYAHAAPRMWTPPLPPLDGWSRSEGGVNRPRGSAVVKELRRREKA